MVLKPLLVVVVGVTSMSNKGYTLIELMVVLIVIGILAAVAAPSFALQIKKNRITSHANQLQSTFKYARSEAAKREKQIDLIAADGKWTVQVNETKEVLSVFEPTHSSISVTNLSTLIISATGATTEMDLTVTDGDSETDDYLLCIYVSGQSKLSTETTCS